MKYFCVLLLFGVELGSEGPRRPEPRQSAHVAIDVSTMFGEAVGRALVILRAPGQSTQYQRTGENHVAFEGIPFGLYEIEIQAAGFNTRRDRLRVYQREVGYWVGLVVAPPHSAEPAEISGVIMGGADLTSKGLLWVRLVALFSSDFIENTVDRSGRFVLAGAPSGRYVLWVFDREKVITAQALEYPGGKQAINIAVK